VNRISAGRLFQTAQALGVEVGYFFGGLGGPRRRRRRGPRLTSQQRLLLELARSFTRLPSRRHQEALCGLARALAGPTRRRAPEADGSGTRRGPVAARRPRARGRRAAAAPAAGTRRQPRRPGLALGPRSAHVRLAYATNRDARATQRPADAI
jgi:hypothetical protein